MADAISESAAYARPTAAAVTKKHAQDVLDDAIQAAGRQRPGSATNKSPAGRSAGPEVEAGRENA